jgi:probable F420-dependent oxidoreductase
MTHPGDGLHRVGFYLWPFGPHPRTLDSLVDVAMAAERLGADAVFLPWHYTLPSARVFGTFGNTDMPDPLAILPALAQATTRLRIGFNALVLPALHPFAVAKYCATLDRLSNGRLILGVTTGWWTEDFRASGVQMRERGSRMDEAVRILHDLFSDRDITEAGRFWDVRGLRVRPLPAQRPFPLWIGGGSPKAIRRAAQWGHVLCPRQNSSAESIRSVYRAGLNEATRQYGRRVDLASAHTVIVTDGQDQAGNDRLSPVRAYLQALEVAVPADPGRIPPVPEDRLILGTPAHCGAALQARIDAGAGYLIVDCSLNGIGDQSFAMEQMAQFAHDVAPRLRW